MKNQNSKTSIVLVHGAFADGSSWNKVIPLLEAEGFTVTAVQNPLKSLSEDVATTKRVLDAQKGDVVLVGHSYGGAGPHRTTPGESEKEDFVSYGPLPPPGRESLGDVSRRFSAPPARTLRFAG